MDITFNELNENQNKLLDLAIEKIMNVLNSNRQLVKSEEAKLRDLENQMNKLDDLVSGNDGLYNTEKRTKIINFDKMTKSKLNAQLKESERLQDKELELLKKSLSTLVKDPKKENINQIEKFVSKRGFEIYTHLESNPYEINHTVANQLNRIFREAKTKANYIFKKTGSKISINRFIQSKYSGDQKVFRKKNPSTKLTVFILVDQSGSMGGSEIQTATDLTATFLKSIEGLKDITIKVRGYSTPHQDYNSIVGFTKIDSLSEIGKLNNVIGTTPTAEALTMLKEHEIKNTLGDKLLILITDGYPNSGSIGGDIDQYLNHLIKSLKQYNCESFGILIGQGFESMAKIFSNRFAECQTLNEASRTLIRVFQNTVIDFYGK